MLPIRNIVQNFKQDITSQNILNGENSFLVFLALVVSLGLVACCLSLAFFACWRCVRYRRERKDAISFAQRLFLDSDSDESATIVSASTVQYGGTYGAINSSARVADSAWPLVLGWMEVCNSCEPCICCSPLQLLTFSRF